MRIGFYLTDEDFEDNIMTYVTCANSDMDAVLFAIENARKGEKQ